MAGTSSAVSNSFDGRDSLAGQVMIPKKAANKGKKLSVTAKKDTFVQSV